MSPAPVEHSIVSGRSTLWICLLLALITVALFSPITRHAFISVDDTQYIIDNPHVTSGISFRGIVWAFQTDYAANWHPLTWITHMVDCDLFGVRPGGHHLTNLLWHAANSVLLFLLLQQLTGSAWRSAFVAALFAWHPVHVESVAWASERKDVLSAFFWITATMAYVKYVRQPGRGAYLLALGLFACGLMSKPMVVTLPFVWLLLDFWPLRRFSWSGGAAECRIHSAYGSGQPVPHSHEQSAHPKPTEVGAAAGESIKSIAFLLREKLPMIALSIGSSVVTLFAQKAGGAVSSLESIPIGLRLANAVVAYGEYISKTLWPVNLASLYPYDPHLSWILVTVSTLLVALVTLLLIMRAPRVPYLCVGWLWFLGTLVPTIGLVQVGPQSMADRYMYLPSIGLFVMAAWGIDALSQTWRPPRWLLPAAAGLVLAGCLGATQFQLRYWQSTEKLFRHAVEVTADNAFAYDGLGSALEKMGLDNQALACYFESVRLEPRGTEALYDLGSALIKHERLDEAVHYLSEAVERDPNLARAHNNLGKALLHQGRLDEAATHLQEAARLKPDDPEAHYNLGTVLLMQSKLDEAIARYKHALRLKSDYWEAFNNLGATLMRQGRKREGSAQFGEVARLRPQDPEAFLNYGTALLEVGDTQSGVRQFSVAARLSPQDPRPHVKLGEAFAAENNARRAISEYREALRLDANSADALNGLAWILSSDPDSDLRNGTEAVRMAERACALTKKEQPTMLITLAAAYAEVGRYTDAARSAVEAKEAAAATDQRDVGAKAEELHDLFASQRPYRRIN